MTTALQEINFPTTGHQPSPGAENTQKIGEPSHPAPTQRADQRISQIGRWIHGRQY
jgi:hypothetical protein